MNAETYTLSIDVDVTNPGQFFACCGLLELAHRLWPGAEGWFDNSHFCVRNTPSTADFVREVLGEIIHCPVEELDHNDRKTAPISLGGRIRMRLDWWLNSDGESNLFKTWAANCTSRQMFSKWRQPLENLRDKIISNPQRMLFEYERVQGSYGFDSDLGWSRLGVGFSLNEHAGLKELPTRPMVEILGAIGLQRFYPMVDEKQRFVHYCTWSVPLTPLVGQVAVLDLCPLITNVRLQTRFVERGNFKGLDKARVMKGVVNE